MTPEKIKEYLMKILQKNGKAKILSGGVWGNIVSVAGVPTLWAIVLWIYSTTIDRNIWTKYVVTPIMWFILPIAWNFTPVNWNCQIVDAELICVTFWVVISLLAHAFELGCRKIGVCDAAGAYERVFYKQCIVIMALLVCLPITWHYRPQLTKFIHVLACNLRARLPEAPTMQFPFILEIEHQVKYITSTPSVDLPGQSISHSETATSAEQKLPTDDTLQNKSISSTEPNQPAVAQPNKTLVRETDSRGEKAIVAPVTVQSSYTSPSGGILDVLPLPRIAVAHAGTQTENQSTTLQDDVPGESLSLNTERNRKTQQNLDTKIVENRSYEILGKFATRKRHQFIVPNYNLPNRLPGIMRASRDPEVYVCAKPLSSATRGSRNLLSFTSQISLAVHKDPGGSVPDATFVFHRVFAPSDGNAEVVDLLWEDLIHVFHGHSYAVVIDGHSGSGKTYRMCDHNEGIIIATSKRLVDLTEKLSTDAWYWSIECAFLEFGASDTKVKDLSSNQICGFFSVNGSAILKNVTQKRINTHNDMGKYLRNALMNRMTKASTYNHSSSRTDFVCGISIKKKLRKSVETLQTVGQIWLTDLAGNEPLPSVTGFSQDKTLDKETIAINQRRQGFQNALRAWDRIDDNCRESPLALVLKNRPLERSKLLLIYTVSPLREHCSETMHTLKTASEIFSNYQQLSDARSLLLAYGGSNFFQQP